MWVTRRQQVENLTEGTRFVKIQVEWKEILCFINENLASSWNWVRFTLWKFQDFYYSDFMGHQFWRLYCRSCKTAVLAILGDLKMINLVNFSLQKMQKFLKIKIQRLKMCLKMEDFAVLKSMKLISRKIWAKCRKIMTFPHCEIGIFTFEMVWIQHSCKFECWKFIKNQNFWHSSLRL